MGKNKHKKFLENLTFKCLIETEFEEVYNIPHALKGKWNTNHFSTSQPITLELGCGQGEYTVDMSRAYKQKNFIGIDIKGARLWRGAKTVTQEQIPNAAFIRTRIEVITSFFEAGEISELWITFPDPQLKQNRARKRLTSASFLNNYKQFLEPDGIIHLKTDSLHLHQYTKALLEHNHITALECNSDIYGSGYADPRLAIKTTYENKFIEEGLPITYLSWRLPDYAIEEVVFEGDIADGDLDQTRERTPK